jgi:hypothetical protein
MHDLTATVEGLLGEVPGTVAPDVDRRRAVAARIAEAWQSVGGAEAGIEPFVRYWLEENRARSELRRRANARRAVAAAFQTIPRGGDAA